MKVLIMTTAFVLFLSSFAFAFADEHSDYNKDIFGEPKAKNSKIYSAWSNNMSYHIERNTKEGIIVDGPTDNKDYNVDGFGNVVIKDNARVTAPIIVKEDNSNAIMVQRQRH